MMRQFVLRATYRYQRRTWWFTAPDDRSAVSMGAEVVLGLAHDKAVTPSADTRTVWAYGVIELINDLGVVLACMPAKEYANGGV